MSSRGLWVVVDGKPATVAGGLGDLVFTTVADGGSYEASWSMSVPPQFSHPSFQPGKVVQIKSGPSNLWSGVLSAPEFSDDGATFTAVGHGPNAGDWLCFDGSGNTTSIPDVAIDRAIADGLPCTRPVSISSSAFASTAATDDINTIGDLLDDQSLSVSKRWGVNPDAEFYQAADPTDPTLVLFVENVQVSRVDEEYASDVYVRYIDSGTSLFDTKHAQDPVASAENRREYPVDATGLGPIPGSRAQGIADGIIAGGKARYQLTQSFTVTGDRLQNMGGMAAHLPSVRAGEMAITYNARTEQGDPLSSYTFIIGRTEYRAVEDELLIAPANLATRTFGDVVARMLAKGA